MFRERENKQDKAVRGFVSARAGRLRERREWLKRAAKSTLRGDTETARNQIDHAGTYYPDERKPR